MKAMLLSKLCILGKEHSLLTLTELPDPVPAAGELLVRVSACGVCHTELDVIEGRTPPPRLPVVLGHQVVGRGAEAFEIGERVGVAWIYSACGTCTFCLEIQEFALEEADAALVELKTRKIRGAKVLRVD